MFAHHLFMCSGNSVGSEAMKVVEEFLKRNRILTDPNSKVSYYNNNH